MAIVTGGLRGLGRAMVFGLAREGHSVLAIGHYRHRCRRDRGGDRVLAMAQERFGTSQILVNHAGMTLTTIDRARFRRAEPQKFWQVPDDIVHAVPN